MTPRFFALLALVCGLLFASRAPAQVLVYRIDFEHSKGINYHPYEGGYFVAPLLGGASSFLLTSTDGAHTYTASAGGGNLFTAVSGGGDKKAVMSATTGSSSTSTSTTVTSGTASGSLVAIGDINHTIHVKSPTVTLAVTVAKSLVGSAVSADSESTATAPAVDGSIGSAGISDIHLILDESQTNLANSQGLSLTQTVDQLTLLLQQQGFSANTGTTTTGTTTGTTTTGTTTTGTTTTTTGN